VSGSPRPHPAIRARLEAVATMIPHGSRVGDVGSDHGRLPRMLVASGRSSWCVATEHGDGPERRLRTNVEGSPEADRIEVRRGDGLDPLRPEDDLDVIVLSGMGGPVMLRILRSSRLAEVSPRLLVLQPQSGWAGLRAGLAELGRGVQAERLVEDRGRFYTVMLAGTTGTEDRPPAGFSPREWFDVGPSLARDGDPLAVAYWTRRLDRARRRLETAQGGGISVARSECDLAERALALFSSRPAPC